MWLGYFVYRKIEKRLIKSKIKKIKAERNILKNLIKRTQSERFKENFISGLVHNIRMKKYRQREQEIEQELPVWDARLVRFLRKKNKAKKGLLSEK